MTLHLLPAAVLAFQILVSVPAQATAVPIVGGVGVIPIHTVTDHDGPEVWASTDSYKVRFDRGTTIIPYLGSDYSRAQRLTWQTTSVRVGSLELVRGGDEPARWHSKARYEYRYGPVTEVYDVLEQGLEQSFVVHERPAAEGDLVVTGRVDTSLPVPASADAHQELLFRDAGGQGILRYGKAWVLDSAGRKSPIRTTHAGGVIALTVTAEWLAGARFPITVDPLLSPVRVSWTLGSPADRSSVDVVRDARGNDIMVVFTKAASSSDRDVYAVLHQDDWTGATTVFTDLTTNDSPHVRVANSGQNQRYCIVYDTRYYHPLVMGYLARLRYHLHNSGDFNLRTNYVTIPPPAGTHEWQPDVGGLGINTQGVVPARFVVVCQTEPGSRFRNTASSGIAWRLIDENGVVQSPQALPPVSPGAGDQERPSINQVSVPRMLPTSLVAVDWFVAWQERDATSSGDDWTVAGRLITQGIGAIPAGQGWFSTGGHVRSHHRMGPQVTRTHGGGYVVAFSRTPLSAVPAPPTTIEGHSIYAERIGWTIGPFMNQIPVNFPEWLVAGPFAGPRMAVGGTAGGLHHWAFSMHSLRSAGGNGDVHVSRVGARGYVTESARLQAAPSGQQGEAGGLTYDGEQWIVGWAMNGASTAATWVNKFAFPAVSPPTTGGTSCAISSISYDGTQQIGSLSERVLLSGAHSNGLAALLVAFAPDNFDLAPLGMPFCRRLVVTSGPSFVGHLLGTTDNQGAASFALDLPGFLQPDTLYFQWLHEQPFVNPAGLVTTQRLVVPIVR